MRGGLATNASTGIYYVAVPCMHRDKFFGRYKIREYVFHVEVIYTLLGNVR